jgi:hypothetical protein
MVVPQNSPLYCFYKDEAERGLTHSLRVHLKELGETFDK